MHAFYDANGDGLVSYEEFVNALADGKLSKRKQAYIDKIWAALDTENCGKCKGSDMVANLKDPDATKAMLLDCFVQTKGGEESGNVSKEEFYQISMEGATQTPDDSTYIM